MRILLALTHMAQAGEGDVKALRGPYAGTYRLRIGKWRVGSAPFITLVAAQPYRNCDPNLAPRVL